MIYENDHFLGDRNYTLGILYARTCTAAKGSLRSGSDSLPLPRQWNESLWRLMKTGLGSDDDYQYVANSVQFGFSLYTPNDITATEPEGRPYASLAVYGDNVVFASDSNALRQGIQLGVLGMPLGGAIQRGVHKALGHALPQGWSSQISHGGEPTFLYTLQRRRLLTPVKKILANSTCPAIWGVLWAITTACKGVCPRDLGG